MPWRGSAWCATIEIALPAPDRGANKRIVSAITKLSPAPHAQFEDTVEGDALWDDDTLETESAAPKVDER